MNRILVTFVIVSLVIAPMGCQKPYFMTELDYTTFNEVSSDYDQNELEDTFVPEEAPATIRDPGKRVDWEIRLEDAKRLALANNRQIAFLGYQPGEAGTNIDLALSTFDPIFEAGMGWARSERQVSTNIETFGTGQASVTQDLFGGSANQAGLGGGYGSNITSGVNTTDLGPSNIGSIPGQNLFGMSKRNAAGGITRISYGLEYSNTDPISAFVAVNPAWRSVLNLSVEQPLLQGAGIEFNRAPILIARARHEQAIKDFQTNVHTLLRDVENAYWQLYFAYQDLYSREVGMKQAHATWQKEMTKKIVDVGSSPDVAQAREQYEFFRVGRMQAFSRVIEAERALRELLGIEPSDNRRLIPAEDPTIAEFQPNFQAALLEMMELRPELRSQRLAIRAAELEVYRQKNGLLPDLSFIGAYGLTGLDNQFDQSIDRLTDNEFNNWLLGIRVRRAVGERAAHASVKRAQLALSRERDTLRNLELTLRHDIYEAYQNIITNFEIIQAQKDRRAAATVQLKARLDYYRLGRETIDVLLQAQTTFADALRDESQAIVQYNQALVQWEFIRGTILANDNVMIAEEEVSKTSPKLIEQRKKQLMNSLPITIHKGKKTAIDFERDVDVRQIEEEIMGPESAMPAAPADAPTSVYPAPAPLELKTTPAPVTPAPATPPDAPKVVPADPTTAPKAASPQGASKTSTTSKSTAAKTSKTSTTQSVAHKETAPAKEPSPAPTWQPQTKRKQRKNSTTSSAAEAPATLQPIEVVPLSKWSPAGEESGSTIQPK